MAKKIRFGVYTPVSIFEEEQVRLLAEAGVDYATVKIDWIPKDKRADFFDWLYKYGIQATIRDPEFIKLYDGASLIDFDKFDKCPFKDHPAVVSGTYVDEPGLRHFKVIGEEIKKFKERYPNLNVNINLLPMYANSAQLDGGAWQAAIEYYDTTTEEFRHYIDEYVKNVDTEFIGLDVYPLNRIPDPERPDEFPAYYKTEEYAGYCKNIEIVADACRRTGRDFHICVQSCSWADNVREPRGYEMRWQMYTMLSYGAVMFYYYVFADRVRHSGTVLNCRGETTPLYYDIKKIASGIKKLSDIYLSYRNLGAFNVNCDPKITPCLDMESPYLGFKAIEKIESDIPLLVGCFEKKEGEGNAFTLVNYNGFETLESHTVRLKADGKLTLYREGEPTVLTGKDGFYEIELSVGEGVFVTIER